MSTFMLKSEFSMTSGPHGRASHRPLANEKLVLNNKNKLNNKNNLNNKNKLNIMKIS
jgi:hypothetical protein